MTRTVQAEVAAEAKEWPPSQVPTNTYTNINTTTITHQLYKTGTYNIQIKNLFSLVSDRKEKYLFYAHKIQT